MNYIAYNSSSLRSLEKSAYVMRAWLTLAAVALVFLAFVVVFMSVGTHEGIDTTAASAAAMQSADVPTTAESMRIESAAAILDTLPDTFDARLEDLTPAYAVLVYEEQDPSTMSGTNSDETVRRSAYRIAYIGETSNIDARIAQTAIGSTVRATVRTIPGTADEPAMEVLVSLTPAP